jgi:uncharacterized protein YndB with AHSA1/START domain
MLEQRNSTVAFEPDAPTHVRRSVDLPAPVAEVWASLTEPDRFGSWFGAEVEMEIRRGGRLTFRWPGGVERAAVLEDVDPERLLTFRWLPFVSVEGRPQPTVAGRVELAMEAIPEGTRLTVTEWTSWRSTGALSYRAAWPPGPRASVA